MVIAIGLDLAWSNRNPSGGAVLVDGVLRAARADLAGNDDIVAWVGRWLDGTTPVVVAVDAPLCVPNMTGRRACEQQLSADWQRYDAGPYPANRTRFAAMGLRGEDIATLLADAYGFAMTTDFDATVSSHYLCEVFPHPAHVSLFQRKSILRYKKKGGRSYEECWAGLAEYAALLQTLSQRDPALYDPHGHIPAAFEGKRGRALKMVEDTLDAITCAYVAAYLWRHGRAGTWVYGTVTDGHILVPRYPPAATLC